MLKKINEKLTHYTIAESPKAIGEDGEYVHGKGVNVGYSVVNNETGMTEFTTMVLPTAIFQADYLDKALESLLNPPADVEMDAKAAGDDVMLQ